MCFCGRDLTGSTTKMTKPVPADNQAAAVTMPPREYGRERNGWHFMPYPLSFAAGAMLYVVVEELIPEMSAGTHSDIGVISFAAGFSIMMALDVALG